MRNRIVIFIVIIGVFINNALGKYEPNKVDSLKNEIEVLRHQVNELDERQRFYGEQINGQTGLLDTAFDGISAELSASSNFIGILGIIIAIISVGLGVYVARIEKNVKIMKTDSELLLQRNIQIKQEVEELSEKMTKDISGLYTLIRNEESNQMIDRLISVPEDIINLFNNLTSRDLEKEHFSKIKEAFLQLEPNVLGYQSYLTLFFQHFSDLSLLDNDIKPKFLKSLPENFSNAFKNDILKSTNDFFNAVLQQSISKSINEINEYILTLCNSSFAETEEVYFVINNAMKSRGSKFELYDCISKAIEFRLFRKNFGKLILDYKFENLSPKENAIIQDINSVTTI